MQVSELNAQDIRDIQTTQRHEVLNRILNEIRDDVVGGGFTVDRYQYSGPMDGSLEAELSSRGFTVTQNPEATMGDPSWLITWA